MPRVLQALTSLAAILTPVSEDVVGFDDYVTNIYAHAKSDSLVLRVTLVELTDPSLKLYRARTASTALGNSAKNPSPGFSRHARYVWRRWSRRRGRAAPLLGVRSLFVQVHKSRITGHVAANIADNLARSELTDLEPWPTNPAWQIYTPI